MKLFGHHHVVVGWKTVQIHSSRLKMAGGGYHFRSHFSLFSFSINNFCYEMAADGHIISKIDRICPLLINDYIKYDFLFLFVVIFWNSLAYGVSVSLLIRYARVCLKYANILFRRSILVSKLLKQGYSSGNFRLLL